MSWDTYNRRRDMVRQVLGRAEESHETVAELLSVMDPEGEVFEAETEFLLDVQMAWFQSLSGELDRSRYLGSSDLTILAAHAWAQTAADMPGARRLLDAASGKPELAKAFAKEDALLSVSAGVETYRTAEHAGRIREVARDMHVAPRQRQLNSRHTLWSRVRSVMSGDNRAA